MLFPVCPLLHKYVVLAGGLEILSVVFSPLQNVVVPAILGVLGSGVMFTIVALLTAEVQPLEIACTEKFPAAFVVMLFPVCPLLHKYMVFAAGLETLNVVLLPAQKVVVPAILGAVGSGVMFVTVALLTAEVQPLEIACTEKFPAAFVVMLFPVCPLLHKYMVLATGLETLSVVFPSSQKVVVPAILGVMGSGVIFVIVALLTAEVQPLEMACTEKLAAAFTVMLFPVCPLLHKYVVLAAGLETLSVVLFPSQNVVVPAMLGAIGSGVMFVTVALLTAEVQPLEIACTEKFPAIFVVILFPACPLLHK
jgi:hypothetical protein